MGGGGGGGEVRRGVAGMMWEDEGRRGKRRREKRKRERREGKKEGRREGRKNLWEGGVNRLHVYIYHISHTHSCIW